MATTEPLRVFISYPSEHRPLALELRDQLKSWGHETWFDKDNLLGEYALGSATWREGLAEGITWANVMVGLASPESFDSHWVMEEWLAALDLKKKLFILIVKKFEKEFGYRGLQYIDLVADKKRGFDQLKEALEIFQTVTLPQPSTTPSYHTNPKRKIDKFAIGSRDPLKDRQHMLNRLQQGWIEGVLYASLEDAQDLHIGLQTRPKAVLQHKDLGAFQVTDTSNVRAIYDRLDSFLILGDPGAGKTIMLLQLAESLAKNPPKFPVNAIPAVFNLSSWSLNPRPLKEWLLEEFTIRYQVKRDRTEFWFKNHQLILLLDALDEVKESLRADCLTAINEFHQQHPEIPLVVSSRIKDYEALQAQLNLHGAVFVRPLRYREVCQALGTNPDLDGLRTALSQDKTLRNMSRTPFLLNTMIFTYKGQLAEKIEVIPFAPARRKHLFDRYVRLRLADYTDYPLEENLKYLTWLATKMNAYVQSSFRVEDIQPYWFADDEQIMRCLNFFTFFGLIFFHYWILQIGIRRKLPFHLSQWLENMSYRRILREFAGGHVFIHRDALQAFTKTSEIDDLISGISDINEYRYYARILVEIGEPAIEKLILQLNNYSLSWLTAVSILKGIGQPAVDSLVYGLLSQNNNVRRGCAEVLGAIGDVRAIEPLIKILSDQDEWVRVTATIALRKMKDARSIEGLTMVLSDKAPWVRAGAIEALSEMNDKDIINKIAPMLSDAVFFDREMRVCDVAAIALKKINTPESRGKLEEWFAEGNKIMVISPLRK